MRADEERALRVRNYVTVFLGVVFPLGISGTVSSFRKFFQGMDCELPLVTRIVLGVPTSLWIALSVVAAGVMVAKSLFLSARASKLVDAAAFAVAALVITVVVCGMFAGMHAATGFLGH